MKYGKLPIRDSNEVIAVGDIHGESGKLRGLLTQVTPFLDKNPKCHLVFCGDYCNGGVNTPRTLDILVATKNKYPEQAFFIEGNHEEMIKLALMKDFRWSKYIQKTLEEMRNYWKIDPPDIENVAKFLLKRGIVDFLDELLPYYESNDVICTHAGLDPVMCHSYGLGDNTLNDLLDEDDKVEENFILDRMAGYELKWNFVSEDPKLSKVKHMDKFLISGHQYAHHKSPRLFKHRAFIDTGCGKRHDKPLTALKFPGKQIFQQY
jgi:hypothetical protein